MSEAEELLQAAAELDQLSARSRDAATSDEAQALVRFTEEVGRTWSRSNIGYFSRVYFENFREPPVGCTFDDETGFIESALRWVNQGWIEYTEEQVIDEIARRANGRPWENLFQTYETIHSAYYELKLRILSLIDGADTTDSFLQKCRDELNSHKLPTAQEAISKILPKRQFICRDRRAISGGIQVSPHQRIETSVKILEYSAYILEVAAKIARTAGSHIERKEKKRLSEKRLGTNIFIGHGRSPVWRDLKDFVKDRLNLPVDEFNMIPVAGLATVDRLSQMLDGAAFAFLILTADDEQADGAIRARQNVVHEVGLFQGRLGFSRAIVLLEEGCDDFSNIHGLGHIRFPVGNVQAVFEEIRRVLEREEIISSAV